MEGDICVNQLLESVVNERLALGNIDFFMDFLQTSLSSQTSQNQNSINDMFSLMRFIATVCYEVFDYCTESQLKTLINISGHTSIHNYARLETFYH
jgi:hypothetical protein